MVWPDMQFDYPHTLEQSDASERIGALCSYLFNRHGIKVDWDGTSGTFDGKYLMVKIQGKMVVESNRVHFDGKDPGVLWRKKAIKYLKGKLESYLDPTTPSADLPTR